MKQEDIIRMAREAELYEDGQFFVCKHEELERFAALVAAAEREALAQKFDGPVWSYDYREIAAVIRARGNK